MNVFGGAVVGSGVAASFAVAGFDGLGIMTATAGGAFLLAAVARALRGKPRKPRPFPRPRAEPLTGWRLAAVALAAFACLCGCVLQSMWGSMAGTVALGVTAALLAGWCAVAGREENREPEARYPWTDRDKAILSGDLSLEAWAKTGQRERGGQC